MRVPRETSEGPEGWLLSDESHSFLPGSKREEQRKWSQISPGQFYTDIRENLFPGRVFRHWNWLPQAMVESLSVEVLMKSVFCSWTHGLMGDLAALG